MALRLNDGNVFPTLSDFCSYFEGREGVKWELGFAFFRGWEMGFCALGLGFMKEKNNRKMGMGFQFEQHRLGLWDLR